MRRPAKGWRLALWHWWFYRRALRTRAWKEGFKAGYNHAAQDNAGRSFSELEQMGRFIMTGRHQ